GGVGEDGAGDGVVERYATQACGDGRTAARLAEQIQRAPDDPVFSLLSIRLEQDGVETLVFRNGAPVRLTLSYRVKQSVRSLRLYVEVRDEFDDVLVQSFHDEAAETPSH